MFFFCSSHTFCFLWVFVPLGLCLSVCIFPQCLVVSDCPCILKSDVLKRLFCWDVSWGDFWQSVSLHIFFWAGQFPRRRFFHIPGCRGNTSLSICMLMAQSREGTAWGTPLFSTALQLSVKPSVPNSWVSLLSFLLRCPSEVLLGRGRGSCPVECRGDSEF